MRPLCVLFTTLLCLSRAGAQSCSNFQIQFLTLQPQFSAPVGQSVDVQVKVTECGSRNPFTDGTVRASFSNQDQLIDFKNMGNGLWDGNWVPEHAAPIASITVFAASSDGRLAGYQLSGSVPPPPPLVSLDKSALSFAVTAGASTTSQILTAANTDSQPHFVTASAKGAAWLSVTPSGGGAIQPGGTLPFQVIVDPSALSNPPYQGEVDVTSDGQTIGTASVAVSVSPPAAPLQLTADAFVSFTLFTTDPSASRTITVTNSNPVGAQVTIQTSDPWLTASTASFNLNANSSQTFTVTASPASLAPEQYNGSITVQPTGGQLLQIPVELLVQTPPQPSLSLDKPTLTFTAVPGGPIQTQPISVLNSGPGPGPFIITISGSAPWLLPVTPTAGTVAAATSPGSPSSVLVFVSVDPRNLSSGTFRTTFGITAPSSGFSATVSITINVVANAPTLTVSQTALTFTAVVGGGSIPGQNIAIGNAGAGTLNWSAGVATLSGGAWLQLSPPSGSVAAGASQNNSVSVNAAGLSLGDYSGQVTITAPGAANAPQSAMITLHVLPAGSSASPTIQPSGLSFVATAGGQDPAAQMLTLQNPSGQSLTFTSSAVGTWLRYAPATGTLAPGGASVSVQPSIQGLAAGSYQGSVSYHFSDGSTSSASVQLIVNASGVGICSPTMLLVQPTSLTDPSSSVVLGQPAPLQARVVDNCGNGVGGAGAVTATFSNSDPPVHLVSVGSGPWSGIWTPRNSSQTRVTVTLTAFLGLGPTLLVGSAAITVTLTSNSAGFPVTTGVVSAASFVGTSIGPGELVAIFGQQMASGATQAAALPLPTQLGGTQVLMGGIALPLLYVSAGQINAQIPFNLPVNSTQQLVVQRGATLSVPQNVLVAAAQPGVYTQDQSGQGAGIIVNGVTNALITPATPAKAGDVVVIYCNGLGSVNPPVPSGAGAPSGGPLSSTVNPVIITIGGVSATVNFVGLTPGIPALYQVNAVVPAGVTPGNQVPVVLTVAGQLSPPVTMAVR